MAKDPLLAARKPEWAVQHVNGGLWRDRLDFAWVDAFNDSVWVYAAQLAAEAVRMGFAEVQYDYVRFPDEPPSRHGLSRLSRPRLGRDQAAGSGPQPRAPAGADQASGRAVHHRRLRSHHDATGDMGIGQMWEDLVTTADVVLPMVYPSHYYRGMYYSRSTPTASRTRSSAGR